MHITAPRSVTRRYTQHLVGTPAQVFLLLCPVRESEWIEGWEPLSVISQSGFAEPDCVFLTPTETHDTVWYITRHEPENGFVEMLRIIPQLTACRLRIQLQPLADGCTAEVSYTHTSLGAEGDAFVASFTEEYYERFMHDWETRSRHRSALRVCSHSACGSRCSRKASETRRELKPMVVPLARRATPYRPLSGSNPKGKPWAGRRAPGAWRCIPAQDLRDRPSNENTP